MIRSERGVSTVIDVALALLLISASVLMIGFYLHDTEESVDAQRSERTAETLSSVTVTAEYERRPPADSENFDEPTLVTEDMYRQSVYASGTGAIADAAVTNMTIGGEDVLEYSDDYADSVDAAVRSAMVASNDEFYALATWHPHPDSSIYGNVTVGERPPRTEDVTSKTITVDSGAELDEAALAAELQDIEETTGKTFGEHGKAKIADAIAIAIVEDQFPANESQRALESQALSRQLKLYHYQQMGDAIGADFPDPEHSWSPLNRKADAPSANQILVDNLSAYIESDLEDGQLIEEIESLDDETSGDEFGTEVEVLLEEEIAVDEVTITIQTWKP